MSSFDRDLLAAKATAIERHLQRVEQRLPATADELLPSTDASDAVLLHLWQAVQLALDLGFAACLHLHLPAPATYADAFRTLAQHGVIAADLAQRLARAAGFRNLVAHAYESLDMGAVYAAAKDGPADLRQLMSDLHRLLSSAPPS